jgi:hypothetical protein
LVEGALGAFLVVTAALAFNGTAGLDGIAVTAFPLPLSSAGKSSDCNAVCEDCEAMAFESPVFVANAFTSFFACDVDVSCLDFGL